MFWVVIHVRFYTASIFLTETLVPKPLQLMWALSGLFLTIASTFIQPSMLLPSLAGEGNNVAIASISVTMQIGAVLLTGCLGGRYAALLSQITYIALGLSGFGVFYQGGGLSYLKSPAFGYLLGFVVGGWLCGFLAFLRPPSLAQMAISCFGGLIAIHLIGIIYLVAIQIPNFSAIQTSFWQYSVQVLSGQFLVVCATIVIATISRKLLFY
jgi:biotin transport system substrate-specific component